MCFFRPFSERAGPSYKLPRQPYRSDKPISAEHRSLPHRSVLAAMFEGGIGVVSADALLSMDEDTWGHLRDRINMRRAEALKRPLAKCLRCGTAVYIKVSPDGRTPLFAHHGEAPIDCPWYTGKTLRPDSVRAAQYMGRQESELHRRLCEKMAELASADPRFRSSTVNKYFEANDGRGRFPDVHLEFEGLGPFTLEFQLSHTFATEVAARNRFYRRHGVGLLWILWDIDPRAGELATAIKDVVRPHRGNLFRIDERSTLASEAQKTLVLSCFTKSADGSWSNPKLVRLDELTVPEKGLPYFRDCRTIALKRLGEDARKRWLPVVQRFAPLRGNVFDQGAYNRAYASLRAKIGMPLREWRWSMRQHFGRDVDHHILDVLAILFSIAGTANYGSRNYASRHENPLAMLNTRLSGERMWRYASLFEELLNNTAARHLLEAKSLRHAIAEAKAHAPAQISRGEALWEAAAWIFPEALNPLVRDELGEIGELPSWACEPAGSLEESADGEPVQKIVGA